jgi:hypothetical protein
LKIWIYAAVGLLVASIIGVLLEGDSSGTGEVGVGIAEALVSYGPLLIVLLLSAGIYWLVKISFSKRKEPRSEFDNAPTDPVERMKWQNREPPYDK